MEGLRKTTKNFSQYSKHSGQDLNEQLWNTKEESENLTVTFSTFAS